MVHWRLLSPLTRVLLVLTLAGLLVEVLLMILHVPTTLLIGAVLLLAIAALWLRRRDLNRAIAIQLERDAAEERERARHEE